MEYLNPLKVFEQMVRRYQIMVVSLLIILGISILAVPVILKGELCSVIEQDGVASVIKNKPWKTSTMRIEGFVRSYLSARFEWTPESFASRKKELQVFTDTAIFSKLKESTSSFESLATIQHASSFYVFKGYAFSNSKKKIEARIIRVLQIKSVTVATPLVIRLSYEDVQVSESNPYGLVVTGIEEVESTDEPQANEAGGNR